MLGALLLFVATVSSFPTSSSKVQSVFLTDALNYIPKIRDVEIGQLNFLHTTDTHGWVGSHRTQADYSAAWGDYISFAQRFRQNRIGPKQDLVIIDTGDKRRGNGLSDTTRPAGLYTTDIFNQQEFDLLCLGNHELYDERVSVLEYQKTASNDAFKEKYVSSNVDFLKEDGTRVPFGSKYRYFETSNLKLRILSLSFIFDFKYSNPRAIVTPIAEELRKPWLPELFSKYPEGEIDVLLIFGHLPISSQYDQELKELHAFLRKYYPNTVIQYFGGHTHVRDFVVLDEKSTGLQSGRFAETVGFLSIDGLHSAKPKFFRRYLDFNLNSFMHHAHISDERAFHTPKGIAVNDAIKELYAKLDSNKVFGQVPDTYYVNFKPLDSHNNIYNFLTSEVLPTLDSDVYNTSITRVIMINTGAIRYDLYKGDFTTDTEYIVSPFDNDWNFVRIPLKLALGTIEYLNAGPEILRREIGTYDVKVNTCPVIVDDNLTEGYTTTDDFGCDGDDTPHQTWQTYPISNVVYSLQLNTKTVDLDQPVDFVFYSFLNKKVLEALNVLTKALSLSDKEYTNGDIMSYGGKSTKTLLREYIQKISAK